MIGHSAIEVGIKSASHYLNLNFDIIYYYGKLKRVITLNCTHLNTVVQNYVVIYSSDLRAAPMPFLIIKILFVDRLVLLQLEYVFLVLLALQEFVYVV